MSDLEELKRLAQAATDIADGKLWLMRIRQMFATGHDERFIIATTPAAVLALIERVEEAERRADVRQKLLDAEKAERDAQREHQAEERNTWARALEQTVSERDAYKERVALLEGWSKATTAALTGEETTELRVAWTCEAVRELKARAELAEKRVAARDKAFSDYVEQHGVVHDGEDCPEDDTCECPLVVALNATFRVNE